MGFTMRTVLVKLEIHTIITPCLSAQPTDGSKG